MKTFLNSYFNIIRKFIPQKPIPPAVGIDIRQKEIILVEISQVPEDGGGYMLSRFDFEPLEEGKVLEGLKSLLSRLEVPCINPVTGICGKGTLIRYIQMPRMSSDDMRKSFQLESDKYFPFPADQIYTDCFILDSAEKSKKMHVLAAAAKCSLIDERLDLLKGLDLKPDFIAINSLATLNIIQSLGFQGKPKEEDAIAVFDMGSNVSHLSIVLGRQSLFTRDIYTGGEEIGQKIRNSLGVTDAELEALKINPGQKKEAIINAYELVVMNVIQEMKLSFEYFTSENSKDIKRLLIVGEIAGLPEIKDILERNLNMEIELWNPLQGFKIPEEIPREELNQKKYIVGTALGLALNCYD